jgi:hypothetical protein
MDFLPAPVAWAVVILTLVTIGLVFGLEWWRNRRDGH